MAPPGRVRSRRRAGAVYSQNALRRTHPMKEKAGQKHKPADVFEFPDNSEISSNGSENKKDDEPYETFDPPLHSTAIYADEEELCQHCGSSVPSTPPGKATQESLSISASEASENASVRLRAKKRGRRRKPLSDGSESSGESEIRRKVQSPERIGARRCDAVPAGACAVREAGGGRQPWRRCTCGRRDLGRENPEKGDWVAGVASSSLTCCPTVPAPAAFCVDFSSASRCCSGSPCPSHHCCDLTPARQ